MLEEDDFKFGCYENSTYLCLAVAVKNGPIGQTQEIITLGVGSEPT